MQTVDLDSLFNYLTAESISGCATKRIYFCYVIGHQHHSNENICRPVNLNSQRPFFEIYRINPSTIAALKAELPNGSQR